MDDRSELTEAAGRLGLALDLGAFERLICFAALLASGAVHAGLIAEGDRSRVLVRHVLDCLRAAVVLRDEDRVAMDLGSGAGLPGLVVAAAIPSVRVDLVETRRRRVAFLERAVEELEMANVRVLHARIEEVREQVDVCFARALAPLEDAWRLAAPRLGSGGRLVYFAGRTGAQAPSGAEVSSTEVVPSPLLESSGPLVIMTRQ